MHHINSEMYTNGIDHPTNTVPRKKPWIQVLLQKEVTKPQTYISMEMAPGIYESHSFGMGPTRLPHTHESKYHYETSTHFTPTIPPVTMTTDELFSHYKQPQKPLLGPMYLIIQGHSKVKSYGSEHTNGTVAKSAKIVPVQSIEDPIVNHVVSHDEYDKKFEVKHLHQKQETAIDMDKGVMLTTPPSSSDSLLSLLGTSFGDFLLNEEERFTNDNNSTAFGLNSNEIVKRH